MELTQEYFDQKLGNLVTKGDLEGLARKEDLIELRTDIVALQDDMRSIKSVLSEMSEKLTDLDRRDMEDSNAFAKTLVNYDEQLQVISKDIKHLKLKQA